MGRKETEEAIADSRAGRVTRVGSVAELQADLNADAMQEKAGLVTRIGQTIKARQLSNDQAAAALALTPAELGELLAGRFRAHSVEDLERLAALLDEAGR